MEQGLNFDTVLTEVDQILELHPKDFRKTKFLWGKLDQRLEKMLDAAKIDAVRYRRLCEILTPLRTAASKLMQSMSNAKRGVSMRDDWIRFAEHDLVTLKDELLALKESIIEDADFLKFACLRAQLRELGRANPERLFEELYRAGAISERTWVLLMAQPNSWKNVLKDRELSNKLEQISAWLLELEDLRKERRN